MSMIEQTTVPSLAYVRHLFLMSRNTQFCQYTVCILAELLNYLLGVWHRKWKYRRPLPTFYELFGMFSLLTNGCIKWNRVEYFTFLCHPLWYTYVIRTNKMHNFFVDVLIKLWCLWHVSNIHVFIIRKTCTYMQFDGISCTHQTHPTIDQTTYMDACKKYHQNACTNLPQDEHLDVRNMSKTL